MTVVQILFLFSMIQPVQAEANNLPSEAMQDVATAIAVYNYHNPKFIEKYSKAIFELFGKCDLEPTVENINALNIKFDKIARAMRFVIPFQPILNWKFSRAVKQTPYSFNNLGTLRSNVFDLFKSIREDVNAGDFESCRVKIDLMLAKVSSERVEYLQSLVSNQIP